MILCWYFKTSASYARLSPACTRLTSSRSLISPIRAFPHFRARSLHPDKLTDDATRSSRRRLIFQVRDNPEWRCCTNGHGGGVLVVLRCETQDYWTHVPPPQLGRV